MYAAFVLEGNIGNAATTGIHRGYLQDRYHCILFTLSVVNYASSLIPEPQIVGIISSSSSLSGTNFLDSFVENFGV